MRAETLMAGSTGAMDAKLMTSGEDMERAVTATGTVQADAYLLKAGFTEVTTSAAGAGARLPANTTPGDEFWVVNKGANACLVYPPVGGAIDLGATDAAMSVASAANGLFKAITSLIWAAIVA